LVDLFISNMGAEAEATGGSARVYQVRNPTSDSSAVLCAMSNAASRCN
jgi:hypothetical protein